MPAAAPKRKRPRVYRHTPPKDYPPINGETTFGPLMHPERNGQSGPRSILDERMVRGVVIGALAAGASNLVAASVALAAGHGSVTEEMIAEKRQKDPVFAEECDNAVARADSIVVQSLFHAATTGQDVAAMIFWLKNRQPHLWRDMRQIDVTVPDLPGALRTAAERARARREAIAAALRAEAIPAEVVGTQALVPFVPGGNGKSGNGNGHG